MTRVDERGSAEWIRADWLPLTEPPSLQSIEVARFLASDFRAAWTVAQGVGKRDVPLEFGEGDSPALMLRGTGARLASMPVALTAAELHHATVVFDIPEGEREVFRLAFRTGERIRAYSDLETVVGEAGHERVELDLAQVRPLEGGFDSITFETRGSSTACGIISLGFTRTSLLGFLPTPHGGAGLVAVGDDGRLGVALDADHPVACEVAAPAGSEFQLSYRVGTRAEFGDAAIVLDGGGLAEERLRLGGAQETGWRVFRRVLSDAPSEPIRVRVEGGTGAEGEVIGFVADAGALVHGAGAAPPTVLLVTSDTHRGELIGMTSGGLVQTPMLDALGQRGLVFLDAASTCNATNPSHVALMTGLHPRDTHVVTNRDPLGRRAETLAERFSAAGYRTAAAFSAFHLGDDTSGLAQGFDRYDGPGAPTGLDFDAFRGAASATRDGADTVARALEHLDSAAGAPLFLWVHVFDAHTPYRPKGVFDRRYLSGPPLDGPEAAWPVPAEKVPRFLRGEADPEAPWAQYRALVDYVDHVLTPLLRSPRVAEGIVAFTSDHGESFGEHGIWWNHAGVYPATTHVPLILAWPGAAASTVETPVRQADLGKTLLELAGLDSSRSFRGRDLRLALEPESQVAPRFTLGYHGRSASIDDGRWLLVLHLLEESNDEGTHTWLPGEVEIFDRLADPRCERNLVEARLDRARALRRRLIEWLDSGDIEGYRAEYHVKAAIDEALAELGYAGGVELTGQWYDPARGDAFLERFGER